MDVWFTVPLLGLNALEFASACVGQQEETSAQHVPLGGLPTVAGDGLDHTVLGARARLTCLVAHFYCLMVRSQRIPRVFVQVADVT